MNLRGHKYDEETGVYISEEYIAPHAHNLFLQYAYWFGIPTAVALMILLVLCFIRFLGMIKNNQLSTACLMGLSILAFVVFGMFEVDWGVGNLSLSMFFIVMYFAMEKKHVRE